MGAKNFTWGFFPPKNFLRRAHIRPPPPPRQTSTVPIEPTSRGSNACAFVFLWVLLPSNMFLSMILCPMLTQSTAALPPPPQQQSRSNNDMIMTTTSTTFCGMEWRCVDSGGVGGGPMQGGGRLQRHDCRHEEIDGGPLRAQWHHIMEGTGKGRWRGLSAIPHMIDSYQQSN
jgi:hypothetical protein